MLRSTIYQWKTQPQCSAAKPNPATSGFRSILVLPGKPLLLCLILWATGLPGMLPGGEYHVDSYPSPANPESGWMLQGDADIFMESAGAGEARFFWNTELPNSSVYFPLGTTLDHRSNFEFSVTMELTSMDIDFIPESFYGFQISMGFHESASIQDSSFRRGTGTDSPNLVEWNFFPDTGFGATVSPVITDSQSAFFASFNFPVDIPLNEEVIITGSYDGQLMEFRSTLITSGSGPVEMDPVKLPESDEFQGFAVDAFGLTSYADFDGNGQLEASARIVAVDLSWRRRTDNNSIASPVDLTANPDGISAVMPAGGPESGTIRLWNTADFEKWQFVKAVPVDASALEGGSAVVSLLEGNPLQNTEAQARFFKAEFIPAL